jgi:hypothetical protein
MFGFKSRAEKKIEEEIAKQTGHEPGCTCQECNLKAISVNFDSASKDFRDMRVSWVDKLFGDDE